MKRNCHIRELAQLQYSNGTDFTLPGSTADRYTYAYFYDNFGRLISSSRYAGASVNPNNIFTERNLSFDSNGNILTITRYGNGNATIKDSFIYSYDGNRLKKLDGTFNGSAITHPIQSEGNTIQTPGTANYIYDGNGNMTLDALRNITLTYDINNLVSTVSRNDTLLSTYHYLADGTNYKVVDKDNKGRAYIGPFSYALEKIGNTVYSYLEGIDTDGGRIMVLKKQNGNQTTADYTTAFFVRDHLGSSRVMLNSQGDILERDAYYPFGLQMNQGKAYPTLSERLPQLYTGYISPTPARRDLYNGKEIQTTAGTDYIDYGFRQYDPVTARWMAIDPMAEKYLPLTAYNYCAGNPISYIDFKGDSIVVDNVGNIIEQKGSDKMVYLSTDSNKFELLGELGKTINADKIYHNLLEKNAKEASEIIIPFIFKQKVNTNGDWDLKNMKETIWGLGNDGKTVFVFQGKEMESQDIGNHHFGVVVKAYGLFSETFALKQAGQKQINSGTSKEEWQNYKIQNIYMNDPSGGGYFVQMRYSLPPYGDDPRDQKWIKAGFIYWKEHLKK